ncbi:hypothetical protein TL16_g02808 [Triparma laevis f. inornata]|uniref:Deubiquitinating enzyme MINDY-3/4 conserved domain-containing protein n=1 Tax=Triparma laevis f. inornata TaxID=1714386 RepID=A0A9W7E234_9STRA|nr:hypothetical protein TL16_g02808 [Triparma laevis f. inornata]
MEKQERWRTVSQKLATGKTKRECFNKYRELKEIRNKEKGEISKRQAKELADAKANEPGAEGVEVVADKLETVPAPVPAMVPKPEVDLRGKEAKVEKARPPQEEKKPDVEQKPEAEKKQEEEEEVKVDKPQVVEPQAEVEVEVEVVKPEAVEKEEVKEEEKPKEEEVKEEEKPAAETPVVEPEPVAQEEEKTEKKAVVKTEEVVVADPPAAVDLPAEEDVDDSFDKDYPPSTDKLTLDTAKALRKLIFRDEKAMFNPAWSKQGFFYTKEEDLQYGLIQLEGGPCGVVAAVQAYVFRHMLFGEANELLSGDAAVISDAKENWKTPGKKEQKQAVCYAVAKMIWGSAVSKVGTGDKFGKVSKNRPAMVCIAPDDKAHLTKSKDFKHDGVTEKTQVVTCFNYEDCYQTVKDNLSTFMKKDGAGVILLCYSCILSREIEQVVKDMDSAEGIVPRMIGNHGYANQEFVNLLMTGAAVSNTFDGQKILGDDTGASDDAMTFGGIAQQGDIGFLTLFEAFGNLECGKNFKVPVCPIWVVCSESHYSCLFSPIAKHTVVDEKVRKMDIYYYDPLGEQDEEIKLTLDRDAEDIPEGGGEETDLTPPIDKVVRTKWGRVGVDWNGAEPIL